MGVVPARAPLAKKIAILVGVLLIGVVGIELLIRALIPVRSVGPSFGVYDPIYGQALKKSFRCERITPEFRMRFATNSLGQRGPEPAAFPTDGVLFLGDAFTMGYGVSDGSEFPALVGTALDRRFGAGRVPVVNTGMNDNGNGRWLKLLRLEGRRYRPRAVVFQLAGDDSADNAAERLFRTDAGDVLLEAQPAPARWVRRLQQAFDLLPGLPYSRTLALLREERAPSLALAATRDPAGKPSADEVLTERLLDESLAVAQARHWPALVLAADLDDPEAALAEKTCAARGVKFLRVPPKSQRPDLYYEIDGHWNASGHAYAAALVDNELFAHSEWFGISP